MNFMRIFVAFFLAKLKRTLEYRGMILIWMFESFLYPLVSLLVWLTIAKSSPYIEEQRQQIINYFALLPIVDVITGAWHGMYMASEIRYGKFSKYLLRPIFPLTDAITNNVAEKLFKLIFILPFVVISHLLFTIKVEFNWSMCAVILITLVLSWVLMFLIETIVGLMAFWMDEVSALDSLVDIAGYTLGGSIAPIFLFSPSLKKIASFIPFRYTMAFPLEIITGSLDTKEILFGLSMLTIWIGVFLFIAVVLWKKGVKKYSAVGG